MTQIPKFARTPDWPRKVATVLNRLQNETTTASGTAAWGSVTGTLADQTDLQGALDALDTADDALDTRIDALEAANGTDHRTVTTATTIVAADSVLFADASSAAFTVTLPTLSERRFTVKKIDSTSNVVTISGANNIDGSASVLLTASMQSVTLAGGASQWFIL